MTVNDLFKILELAVHDGRGDAPVYFDTDARNFEHHMAKVGSAYCQDVFGDGTFWLTLHEENKE
jgi:hypothetical protein